MICIGQGTIDWDAIAAISTAAAAIIALLASWVALKAPEWSRQAERKEATHEVLQATREAIEVYRGAAQLVEQKAWPDDLVSMIRIRANHLHETLNRLISRPSLTDGAIAVGAGAMSILAAIIAIPTESEARMAAASRAGNSVLARMVATVGPAKTVIDAAADIVKVVEARAVRVENHMARHWWNNLLGGRADREVDRFTHATS